MESHELTLTTAHDLKDCDERNMMMKIEFKNEDSVTDRESYVEHALVREDSVTDIDLCIKEENDFIMKIEDGRDEITIKQELDIGPTVLQLKTVPHPLLPLTLVSSHGDSNMTSILEISPTDPRSSTGSVDNVTPPPLCLVSVQPEKVQHTEVEDDYSVKYSESLANSGVLHWTREEDVYYRRLSVQTCDRSNNEDTSVGKKERDDYRCYIRPFTKSDSTTDSRTAIPDKHTGRKQDKYRHCKHNTDRELNLIKNVTPTNVCRNPYKSKQYKCSTYQASNLKILTHMDEKPYKCDQYEYSASELGLLKEHMGTHMSEKPYKCQKCEYSTSQPRHFKEHMRTHTGEKPYRCKHCDYSSSRSGSLTIHMRTHTGEKPYKCEQCEYSASQLNSLKSHVRTHTGIKPYKCELCGYNATQLEHLKQHMRIHTGEKPYRCEVCDYSACRLDYLKRHMHLHTGEKPYRCEQCEYSASQLGHLKQHMLTHTGAKPYKCEECEYSTSRQSDLKRHMRTHTDKKL